MIIKPNLYDGPYKVTAKANINDNSNGNYFYIQRKLKEGEKYTFSSKVIVENLKGIENTQFVTLGLYDGTSKRFLSWHKANIEEGKINLVFDGSENITRILSYTGPYGDTIGRGMTWSDVEIVSGDKSNEVFIPSTNSLEPSEQAVFVAGGDSKRCIQSKLFGGGLC